VSELLALICVDLCRKNYSICQSLVTGLVSSYIYICMFLLGILWWII